MNPPPGLQALWAAQYLERLPVDAPGRVEEPQGAKVLSYEG